jgi:succinate dehydrogenase / fumarate reductase cytochrome b subunit
MQALTNFYNSTVGKKVIMAITGLMMIGFLIGHMAGNLKIFAGFDSAGISAIDHYALHLRQLGEAIFGYGNFLWIARIGLLAAIVLHFSAAISLIARNKQARSSNYKVKKYNSSTIASLSMAVGGFIILFFVVFHILHFTTGHVHLHGFKEGYVYENLYSAFQHLWVVGLYTVAMLSIGLHLYHGTWSVFQTLGIDSRGWNNSFRAAAKAISVIVTIGFLAVPWSIYLGKLPAPTGQTVQYPSGH